MHDHRPDLLAQHPLQDNYRLLRIYAWYRALLASALLGMFATGFGQQTLGNSFPQLYGSTAALYTLANLITLTRLLLFKTAPTTRHIFTICLADIVALSLIMFCSGGVSTGLGLLIFITVAAGSIFLQGQIATLLAAIACIAILAESVASGYWRNNEANPLAAALLGILLFVTSQLFQYLTRRIRTSQQDAAEQAAHAEILQRLNEMIVQRMHTGIAVLDGNQRIILYNEAAARLLYLPLQPDPRDHLSLKRYPQLERCLQHWNSNPQQRPEPLQIEEGTPEIQINFARLEQLPAANISTGAFVQIRENMAFHHLLMFVEDTRQISQRAQQMKLASLGHLTANIAHEVRNPLGAISHAAQLLAESDQLCDPDRRLASIIQNHSVRVNQIIENVLQLSRRKAPLPERRDLCEWLRHFTKQHQQTHSKPVDIELQLPAEPLFVHMDFSQLEQVLNNLCSNGLRYSEKLTGQAVIALHAYWHPSLDVPCVDIIDYGAGISEQDRSNIFEPFFTTEQQGTGLGLYIARELCLINQASLDYKRTGDGRSCFQITFPHPNKIL